MPKQQKNKAVSRTNLGLTPFYKQPLFWLIIIIVVLIVAAVLAVNVFKQQKANVVDNSTAAASSKAAKISPQDRMNTDAHYFGNLTTQDLQADPQKYVARQSGNSMVYVWRVSDGEVLVRIDDDDTKKITVYKYAQDTNEMMKNQLYQTNE
ncbi:hypothetical protein OZX65_02700 [Leuconostocaceae bacterium ESL0723]|nr:hypothetical protein OZX65_02700 [Leuconostocaceae bacterium ESL0723]